MMPREGTRIRFPIGALFLFFPNFRLFDSRDRHAAKLKDFLGREKSVERAREARIRRHVKEGRDDPLGRDAHVQGRLDVGAQLALASAECRKRRDRGDGLFLVRESFPRVHRSEDEVVDPLLGVGRDVAQLVREAVRGLSRETFKNGTVGFFLGHKAAPFATILRTFYVRRDSSRIDGSKVTRPPLLLPHEDFLFAENYTSRIANHSQ